MDSKQQFEIEELIKKRCYEDISAFIWDKDLLKIYARSGIYHVLKPTTEHFINGTYKEPQNRVN